MAARRGRRWWLGLLVVLAGLLALAWWFPARWAWFLARNDYPGVSLRDLHGSVWDGTADGLAVRGESLGRLDWTVARLSVLGTARATFSLHGTGLAVKGRVTRPVDRVLVFSDVTFRIPATRFEVSLPAGFTPGGTLVGKVNDLRLVNGWPGVLEARVDWRTATLLKDGHALDLGDLRSNWQSRPGGVISGGLTDTGDGAVALDGGVVVSALGWRVDVTVRQRHANPRLARLLDRLGTRDGTGAVEIRYRGGLAAMEKML